MFNLGTPLTVTIAGWALFLVFGVVFVFRLKKGKLPIVSATLSLIALAAAIWGLFGYYGAPSDRPSNAPRGSYSLDQVVLVYSGTSDRPTAYILRSDESRTEHPIMRVDVDGVSAPTIIASEDGEAVLKTDRLASLGRGHGE